jgi:hypothetical protein
MTISRHTASTAAPAPAAGAVTPPPPAAAPEERTGRPAGPQDDRARLREERLAEMVAELTGCAPAGALEAVRANAGRPDPLDTVARAMIAVEQTDERFRITGYLRPRPQGGRATRPADAPRVAGPRPHPSVVAPVPEAEVTMTTSATDRPGADDWEDDVILDLRQRAPRVHIDLTMLDRMARVRREYRRH